jgi:hypothetical protein
MRPPEWLRGTRGVGHHSVLTRSVAPDTLDGLGHRLANRLHRGRANFAGRFQGTIRRRRCGVLGLDSQFFGAFDRSRNQPSGSGSKVAANLGRIPDRAAGNVAFTCDVSGPIVTLPQERPKDYA